MEDKRQVSTEQAKRFAEGLGVKYLETSAKDKVNIEESFVNLVIEMKKKFKTINSQQTKPPTLIRDVNKTKKMTCC